MSIKYIDEFEARTLILKFTKMFRIRTFSDIVGRDKISGNKLFINTTVGGLNQVLDEVITLPLMARVRYSPKYEKDISYYSVSRVGADFYWSVGGKELLVKLTGRYDFDLYGKDVMSKYILITVDKPDVYITRLNLWLGKENRPYSGGDQHE